MSIDIKLLDDILARMTAAGLSELEFTDGDCRVAMRMGRGAIRPVNRQPVNVLSPAIGIFRSVHPRRQDGGLKTGRPVSKGMVLGYLEVGATLTGIVATASGCLSAVTVADGALVGHGQHVFTIEQEG